MTIGSAVKVTTNQRGAFSAVVPAGTYRVHFSHPSFHSESRQLKAGDSIDIVLVAAFSEAIVVSGIRADESTPVTRTDIDRDEIERRYHQQDVPLLLRDSPSINAYAESGVGGSGYSYITLRGIGASRINFTLDGVPLADGEDFGTYFADFPDIAHSLQSIQIQRGVGTSTVGSPSFGGSVNLESINLATRSETQARLSAGSFGHRFATVGYQSGLSHDGYALYTRLSYNQSDGFRESSGIRQHNLFLSAAKRNDDAEFRVTAFSGHERQQLSFYATDEETLKQNLRFNPLRPEEEDSFGYDLAHLQYLRGVGEDTDLTASIYYQRGYGWYRLFDYGTDDLRQYGLDGLLAGSMFSFDRRRGGLTTRFGVHVNRFEREHTRDLVGGPRDYFNYGIKDEGNAFAKMGYDRAHWHLYGDLQVRSTSFDYHGDVEIEPIRWTFFNPKIGVRYRSTPTSSAYASIGQSTREPARLDLFHGEDNASIPYDPHAVRPERVLDVEAGYDYRRGGVTITANLYAMEFRNEIAATGELSEMGLPLRRNVDRSYRRGIEIDAAWQATPVWRLRTTGNLSRNRIREWTEAHKNVEPLLTPSLTVSQSVDYTPSARFAAAAVARYVSRSYLDNTNDDDLVAPSYLVLDTTLSVSLSRSMRLSMQINNLLDNDRIYPSGYTDGLIAYYYPQATRNFVIMLDVRP